MNQLLAELAKERRQRGKKRSYESVSEKQDNEESSLCKSWACSRCTFLNTINPNICEICRGPNPLSETFSTVLPMLPEHSNVSQPWPIAPATLKVVTWNIAECIPSSRAPLSWHSNSVIQLTHLKQVLESENADIICIQESPSPEFYRKLAPGYKQIGYTQSHCGYVLLLVKNKWKNAILKTTSVSGPVVATKLRFVQKHPKDIEKSSNDIVDVCIASMHLHPSKGFDSNRLKQFKAVVNWCELITDEEIFTPQSKRIKINDDTLNRNSSKKVTWILCGDFNMRKSEDSQIESLLLQQNLVASNNKTLFNPYKISSNPTTTTTPTKNNTKNSKKNNKKSNKKNNKKNNISKIDEKDAWKIVGCPKDKKFTWNSKINKYHKDGFGFTCRFDRVYVHRMNHMKNLKKNDKDNDNISSFVEDFKLIGNQNISENSEHYLSDHFGISCVVSI